MTRQELHELVDEIPEEQLESVAALLVEIVEDDEPLTSAEITALEESDADVKAGRTRPMTDVIAELGL